MNARAPKERTNRNFLFKTGHFDFFEVDLLSCHLDSKKQWFVWIKVMEEVNKLGGFRLSVLRYNICFYCVFNSYHRISQDSGADTGDYAIVIWDYLHIYFK
jgi:hypothetical protein